MLVFKLDGFGCFRPEIPPETPYLASSQNRVVCGDWMVGAPGLEPGTRWL